MSLWTNSEFRKLVQKVVLIQTQNLKNMQGKRDMNKCPVKYIDMDQSNNKDIYKINVKKDIQCSLKTMNIEVLGIF